MYELTPMLALLCRAVFDRVKLASLRIRRVKSYFGRWDCTKGCFDIRHPWKQYEPFCQATGECKAVMYNNQDKRVQHVFTRFNQRDSYREAWLHLQFHEVLVAQDFGTLTCPPNATERDHYVTDYCVLLRWKERDTETGELTEGRLYIDMICDDKTRQNDYYYVRHSWRHLLFNTPHFTKFTHIIIFSDGASKHFKSRFTMKFFADVGVEAGRSMVYNFFASYHGSGLWDAHFAKNNAAIRNFLIHMEGLRRKCESKDFSPLAELKALARILLDALDNTVVYEFVNINRDPSLKPSIKPIQDIKQYHCFQFVDCDHVDCCIMCGDAFPPISHRFQSTSKEVNEDDNNDNKDERSDIHKHIQDDHVDMELDVDVDDDKDDIDITEPVIEREHQSTSSFICTTTSTITSTLRRSKRQRTSRTTFSSSQGSEYLDLDDLDLD